MTASRMWKRYKAAVRKRGVCVGCKFRETTRDVAHCKGREDRSHGWCKEDGRLPQYQFDPAALEQFQDVE